MKKLNKKKIIIAALILIVLITIIVLLIVKTHKKETNVPSVSVQDLKEKVEDDNEKTLDDIVEEFGGTITEKPSIGMCYASKGEALYTIYDDGSIYEGQIVPWDGSIKEIAPDESGNYNIYEAAELKWLADKVINNEDNFETATITIRKTIDLGAREKDDGTWDGPMWNSIVGFVVSEENVQEVTDEEDINVDNANVIDENIKGFAGVFQSENADIRGMRIESDKNYQGLFGFSSGVIQSINLKKSYVKGVSGVGAIVGLNAGKVLNCDVQTTQVLGNDKVGGISGISTTGSFIEDSIVSDKTIVKANENYVGGIAGYTNNNSAINRNSFSGVIDGKEYVGGITGIAFFGIQIEGCSVNGATISGNNIVGGIAGYNKAQISSSNVESVNDKKTSIKGIGNVGGIVGINYTMGNIEKVKSSANIEATGDNVGGIAGINNASITEATNDGSVLVNNEVALKVGGIVGENSSEGSLYTSCNEGEVTNKKHAGGIYGANFGAIENCYYLKDAVKTDNIEDDDLSKTKEEIEALKS